MTPRSLSLSLSLSVSLSLSLSLFPSLQLSSGAVGGPRCLALSASTILELGEGL